MATDSKSLREAIESRRSIYQLTDKSTISEERLKEIITHAIKHTPSSFNSQTTRLVTLVKDEHRKFWDIVGEILKGIVPEDQWEKTKARNTMFRNAYGTILFYEDTEAIQAMQKKVALYADRFPDWSRDTSAMHQYNLWLALEAEGLGANLQHYNPLVNQRASETWDIPAHWDLNAQLVFGAQAEGAKPGEKTFEPIEKRLFFHGA